MRPVSCFPSDFQSKPLRTGPSGWAGSPGLVGAACCVFCVPSWQPAWCWSRVHSTGDYQGTKPDADRSGMSGGGGVAAQGTQGQARPCDCTARQPPPADHGQAGIGRVGHILISQTQVHLEWALADSHGIHSTQISAGMSLTGPPCLEGDQLVRAYK